MTGTHTMLSDSDFLFQSEIGTTTRRETITTTRYSWTWALQVEDAIALIST